MRRIRRARRGGGFCSLTTPLKIFQVCAHVCFVEIHPHENGQQENFFIGLSFHCRVGGVVGFKDNVSSKFQGD